MLPTSPQGLRAGPIRHSRSTAVIRGHEAKTSRKHVVYQRVQLTTATEDVMAALGWTIMLPM